MVHNQSPVSNRHCLFLLNLHQSEVYHFLHSIIRREWTLWFSVLSDFSIQIFYEVCGVDYFPDFQWKLEENSQVISVIPPWKDGIRVLPFPFLFQIIQFYGSSLLVRRVIDVLHIGCKLFLVLVNDIFAGVPWNSSCLDWLGYTLKRKLANRENPLTPSFQTEPIIASFCGKMQCRKKINEGVS